VNTPKNVEIFETLGIEAVSSTRLISELLENEFSVGELIRLTSLRGGRVSLVEVRVPSLESGRAPKPRRIDTLGLPFEAVLVAIFRGDETIIPRGGASVEPGDDVVALTTPDLEDELRAILVGEQ
jgi:trk system potassium uptake protein TrkA